MHRRIERRNAPALGVGERHNVRIGHLSVTCCASQVRSDVARQGARCRLGPALMSTNSRKRGQPIARSTRCCRVSRDRSVRRKSNEAELRDRACCPRRAAEREEPRLGNLSIGVGGPRERQQDVHVEEVALHTSSSRSLFTTARSMGGESGGTGNLGSRLCFWLVGAATTGAEPRFAHSDMTSPIERRVRCATSRASRRTVSSRSSVVRITHHDI